MNENKPLDLQFADRRLKLLGAMSKSMHAIVRDAGKLMVLAQNDATGTRADLEN